MKVKVKRIKRKGIKDKIIEQIVLLITNGKLKNGEKLPPEPILMQQFGVGRSSLREAIGALSLTGVLEVKPGRGTYVCILPEVFLAKPLSWGIMTQLHKLEGLIEVRTVLEVGIAGLAAKKANEEDIARLRKNTDELRTKGKNNKKRVRLDLLFHLAIAEIGRNKLLFRFLSECSQMMRYWREQIASSVPCDTVVSQHENIINAIATHDIEKAKLAMRQHIEWSSDELSRALLIRKEASRKKCLADETL